MGDRGCWSVSLHITLLRSLEMYNVSAAILICVRGAFTPYSPHRTIFWGFLMDFRFEVKVCMTLCHFFRFGWEGGVGTVWGSAFTSGCLRYYYYIVCCSFYSFVWVGRVGVCVSKHQARRGKETIIVIVVVVAATLFKPLYSFFLIKSYRKNKKNSHISVNPFGNINVSILFLRYKRSASCWVKYLVWRNLHFK